MILNTNVTLNTYSTKLEVSKVCTQYFSDLDPDTFCEVILTRQ